MSKQTLIIRKRIANIGYMMTYNMISEGKQTGTKGIQE